MTVDAKKPQQSAFDPLAGDLRQLVVRGAVVIYASQAARLVIQTASLIVMSRLLMPADFGLLAMVTPVYGLALMFQDLGLTQATIQRPQINVAQITAMFWVNVSIGCGLAILLALIAPAIGWFYGDARVTNLTRGFAALIVLSSLAAQHLALINRRMHFSFIAALDVVAFVLGVLGAIPLAILLRNYWALFALPLITALVTLVGAWVGTGFIPGLPKRERNMRELLHMGGGVTGFNVFGFIARNLDNVLIGQAWGNVALGLYDRAYKLLLFPLQQLSTPLARVMLPALARLQHEPDRYRVVYLRALQQLLIVTQPAIVFTIATADTLLPVLLGEPWRGAAPIFKWLGLAAVQQPISATTTWLFVSQGRSRAYMYFGAFNAATSAAAFFAGLPWGPMGVAAAYSITQITLRMPVMWWMATRRGPVKLRDLLDTAAPHAAASMVALLAVLLLRYAVPLDSVLGLAVGLLASYAAALLTLGVIPSGRAMLRESISFIGIVRRDGGAYSGPPAGT
ncbi:MAG TPA: lipopolysaccharide biosynthesis protein [Acetobacteraceae bacterium]